MIPVANENDLVRRYQGLARALACTASSRWKLDPDECESVAMEAMLRSIRGYREGAGTASMGSWIAYLVERRLHDLARQTNGWRWKRKRRTESLSAVVCEGEGSSRDLTGGDLIAVDCREPWEDLAEEEEGRRVLHGLTPMEKRLLWRRYVEGWTQREAAEEVGCGESWVSLLEARARGWLIYADSLRREYVRKR